MRPLAPSLLRHVEFRRLALATVLNAVGMMGEAVVLGWLALELTDSPFLVGVALGSRALPLFFVGLPAGVLADRFPRHRLLIATNLGQAVTATALGVLAAVGIARLPHLLLLTFVAGTIRGVEHAARQSYTHDIVGARELVNGFAILGVAIRSGWLLGSLGAGAVIAAFGSGAGYFTVAASFLAAALALAGASPPARASAGARESVWGSVLGFLGVIRRDRALRVLMLLTAGAEILGFSHQALLPSLARDVLRVGPEGLGVLSAGRAVGGILGLVAVSLRGPAPGGGASFVGVLLAFGLSVVGLGLAPHAVGFAGVVAVVIVVNAVGALADLLAQSLMQLTAPAGQRGRAGGAWVVAIGLAPLGQFQIGALASLFGVTIALGTSGVALIALAAASALLVPRVRR